MMCLKAWAVLQASAAPYESISNQTPVIHPPSRVPITLLLKIQEELAHIENLEVIEKFTEPSYRWVNSIIIIIIKLLFSTTE